MNGEMCQGCKTMLGRLQEFLKEFDKPGDHHVMQALLFEVARRGMEQHGNPFMVIQLLATELAVQQKENEKLWKNAAAA